MHKLLQRQLIKNGVDLKGSTPAFRALTAAVDAAYTQADHDRRLLEHSLDLTSQELVEQNRRLREELAERRRTEQALRESEERYLLAVQGSNVGIWDWDMSTGRVYYSPRWKMMLGYTEGELEDNLEAWFAHVDEEDLPTLRRSLDQHLAGETEQFQYEYRVHCRDGTVRWFFTCGMALRGADAKPYRMAGSQSDISDRKSAEERILHDAIHDGLTGLPNRTLLLDRLDHGLKYCRHHPQERIAVLFLDLDRFKLINDSFGHLAGDCLLVEAARRLGAIIKDSDTLARLGGDEFVVLLGEIRRIEDAVEVAERLLAKLAHPFQVEGHEVFTSASVGIALSTQRHKRPEDLLRDADIAMYRAKARGEARYQVFDTAMHERTMERLHLESDLRRALDKEEFTLAFQPIYCTADLQLSGFEALVRWQHPARGLLQPAQFLNVAEEIDLIVPMDRWVLGQALHHLRAWRSAYPSARDMTINVNVSARQFDHRGFVDWVGDALAESGVGRGALRIEVTESVLVTAGEPSVSSQLEALKELGVELFLDDFGTGYASLRYLHRFPFDGLKIDRFFVQRLAQAGRDEAFVKAILTMADSLGLVPVAEGVEDRRQLEHLQSLGVDQVQGFLLSEPVDAATAEAMIGTAAPPTQCPRQEHDTR